MRVKLQYAKFWNFCLIALFVFSISSLARAERSTMADEYFESIHARDTDYQPLPDWLRDFVREELTGLSMSSRYSGNRGPQTTTDAVLALLDYLPLVRERLSQDLQFRRMYKKSVSCLHDEMLLLISLEIDEAATDPTKVMLREVLLRHLESIVFLAELDEETIYPVAEFPEEGRTK